MRILDLVVTFLPIISIAIGCRAPRQGCYKHENRREHILYSNRAEHEGESFHKGEINWTDYENYFERAICECEKAAAAKNYQFFSFRHFGECHGIKSIEGLTRSYYCFRDLETMCDKNHEKCFGADEGEFIYKVSVQPITEGGACKGFAGHYREKINVKLSASKQITGDFGGRYPFSGQVTIETKSKCSGWVNFPHDRKYTFEYDSESCLIHWDNKDIWENNKCEIMDSQEDACDDMSSEYGKDKPLRVSKDRKISGHIGKRPRFQGAVTLASAKECRGVVNFPDDRSYSFVYDRETCTIHWDGRRRNNKWKKPTCKDIDMKDDACDDMAANYGRDIPLRINKNRRITGHIRRRPKFSGMVTLATKHECRGWVNFPDDRKYYFDYDRDACTIHWDGRWSRNKWRKPSCSSCVGIAGRFYHNVDVKFTGKSLNGVIPGRPRFYGQVDVDTPTRCEGSMKFPDDRTYKFNYDASTCTIHWGDNNYWQNIRCEQHDINSDACLDMASTRYFRDTPLRVSRSREISGHIQRRPHFKGKVTFVNEKECRGVVNFPDDRSYSFIYDRSTCTIHWDGRRSSNKWRKACPRRG